MSAGYHQPHPGRLVRDDELVEAVRFYRSEGASFSGWIVRNVRGFIHGEHPSDPIRTRAEAVEVLLARELSDTA